MQLWDAYKAGEDAAASAYARYLVKVMRAITEPSMRTAWPLMMRQRRCHSFIAIYVIYCCEAWMYPTRVTSTAKLCCLRVDE